MSLLALEGVDKFYGAAQALHNVCFECEEGEFFTLFGPSGAGKTTILELIAGVKADYTGSIRIGGRAMESVPIQSRNVAMAFEDYALYPHLSVEDNIAFPLRSPRAKKIGEAAIRKKVGWIAEELGIGQLLDRSPAQLSGGQKQRVSLARALVREADVYLLDEPIAHLDAKLRTVARANLKAMARDLGATILYVTHDYREALGLSDRVLILNEGRVLQIGKPRTIYHAPATDYVGRLVGDPAMNLLDGLLEAGEAGPRFRAGETVFHLTDKLAEAAQKRLGTGLGTARLGIRPAAVSVAAEPPDARATRLRVYATEGGAESDLVYFEIDKSTFGGTAARSAAVKFDSEVWVTLDGTRGHLFDATFALDAGGGPRLGQGA